MAYIIIAQQVGRLGNRLNLFAHLVAFSKSTGNEIVNLAFEDYAHYFEKTSKDIFNRYPSRATKICNRYLRRCIYLFARLLGKNKRLLKILNICVVEIPPGEEFDLGSSYFLDLCSKNKIIWLQGGWKFTYWQKYRESVVEIRDFLKPASVYNSNIQSIILRARKECEILIGVHIRQTDFKEWRNGAYYFTSEQYAGVMKNIEKCFKGKKVGFVICSDEVQRKSLFEELNCFLGSGEVIEDMYILTECDYIMGSAISSFCGWAAFYGQKPIYQLKDPNITISLQDFIYDDLPLSTRP